MLNENLEERVRQRTQLLEQKLTQLERLNKIMTHREGRILELKQQLANLQKNL